MSALYRRSFPQVAAADVDDEGDLGLERDDVGEVLIRPDAEIHPTRLDGPLQLRDHPLKGILVRHEIVGAEGAVGFR